MTTLEVNVPFALYLLSLFVYALAYLKSDRRWNLAGFTLSVAGWAGQTFFLARRWMEGGRAPMANQHESLLILAWTLMLLYVVYRRKLALPLLGAWISVACLLVLGVASLIDPSIRPLMPALQSNWLLYHVAVIMAGYGALLLSAVVGGIHLFSSRKGRKPSPAKGSLEALDDLDYRALSLGFLLLTGGILLGSVWANEAWGAYWSWDPKETWSLITWFFYATALHLRRSRGWTGRRFSWMSLAGVAFILFTYFGVNYLLSGMHSYR